MFAEPQNGISSSRSREKLPAPALPPLRRPPACPVVAGTRLAEIGAAAARRNRPTCVAALPAGVEHLQLAAEFLQHDLRRVAVVAGLVLPFAGLQLALDIDLRALLQVLLGDLGEVVVEDHDAMPLGLFLALAGILVAPAFRGGDPQIDDRIAGVQPPDFGISPEIADQNDLVDATRHHTSPRSSETSSILKGAP